ncbi:MAG: TIM barrel protein [bacterium]|nr:TIM barrel protein [bacterium]
MNQETTTGLTRRGFIAGTAAAAFAGGLSTGLAGRADAQAEPGAGAAKEWTVKNGRIKQAASRGMAGKLNLETWAAYLAKIGVKGVDLIGPAEWPILKRHGLLCTMTPSHGLTKGINHVENHAECLAKIRESIELTAAAGFPNVICLSGNREGMDDDEGMRNCETAIKQVVGLAEQKGVTLCMELLNSKRNHKDYMCDRTAWGAALVRRIGSPRFKLLYDIYHMQVQEGDVIATIRENIDCIAHFHTAGVPGRHEIDDTQELYYPAIMRAILATGFQGYVAHELGPTRDPLESLRQAVEICDV